MNKQTSLREAGSGEGGGRKELFGNHVALDMHDEYTSGKLDFEISTFSPNVAKGQ